MSDGKTCKDKDENIINGISAHTNIRGIKYECNKFDNSVTKCNTEVYIQNSRYKKKEKKEKKMALNHIDHFKQVYITFKITN